jgi:hypothetical protein
VFNAITAGRSESGLWEVSVRCGIDSAELRMKCCAGRAVVVNAVTLRRSIERSFILSV